MDSDGRGGRLDGDEDVEDSRAGDSRGAVEGGPGGEDRRAPRDAAAPSSEGERVRPEPENEEPAPGDPLHAADLDREEPPAFGVMLHLLGAVALALASLVWGALLLFGAVESTGLRVLGVFAGLTLAVAWFAWLVRATMGREFRDDEPGPHGAAPPDDPPY